jgi:DNA-binding NarL/FixJ family response regulator
MIGESVPDQHKQAIVQLAAQIDYFLLTGKKIQHVEPGASAHAPLLGTTNHMETLKAKRAKRAPKVRALAKQGMSARDIGKKLGVDTRTIALTAKEHGITFSTAN